MDKELLKKASALNNEISECKYDLERLKANAMPSSLLKIEVNQCYGDMGMAFTNRAEFKGEIASRLFHVIIENLEERIAHLEKQLEEL